MVVYHSLEEAILQAVDGRSFPDESLGSRIELVRWWRRVILAQLLSCDVTGISLLELRVRRL